MAGLHSESRKSSRQSGPRMSVAWSMRALTVATARSTFLRWSSMVVVFDQSSVGPRQTARFLEVIFVCSELRSIRCRTQIR